MFAKQRSDLGVTVLDYTGGDLDEARAALTEHHSGQYRRLAEYAEEPTAETTTVPDHLALTIIPHRYLAL